MRLHKILLEYDTQITAQKQGGPLTARWLEDGSAKRDIDGHSAKTPVEILEFLERADPTKNKQYMLWIIKQYLAKNFMYEDIEGLREEIELYHTIKPRIPVIHRDIGKFDLGSFREMMVAYSGGEGGDFDLAGDLDEDDAVILVNSPQGVLARAKTEKGSCELGKGTKWCTASTDYDNYADSYIQGSVKLEEPYGYGLFIYWEYPGKKKYQIHIGDMNEDEGDDYSEYRFTIPYVTVMDAQDQTVFNKDPDWLKKRVNNPVLGGLIKAIQNYYAKTLDEIPMWFTGEDDEEEYFDQDTPYDNFFDSWKKLFPKGPNKDIEAHIIKELPKVKNIQTVKKEMDKFDRGVEIRYIASSLLDTHRFWFALEYLDHLRGSPWPQLDKMILSEIEQANSVLQDKDIEVTFIQRMNRTFMNFHTTLQRYAKKNLISQAVPDAFLKTFKDRFEDPELLNNINSISIVHASNERWADEHFANQMAGQHFTMYGVDIQRIPKAPPVPLHNLPMIKMLRSIKIIQISEGFHINFESVLASKGIFKREGNLFDRLKLTLTKLSNLAENFTRDLPEVALYDDVRNPSTTKQEDTRNGPLLIELKKKLKDAGLTEDQAANLVTNGTAQGYSRQWNWAKVDPSIVDYALFGQRDMSKNEWVSNAEQDKVGAVYDILEPYMYDVADEYYDAVVNNLRSSELGQLSNPILDQMFSQLEQLKTNRRSNLRRIFVLARNRFEIAAEQFALQAGLPVQFDANGFVNNTTKRPDADVDAKGVPVDYSGPDLMDFSRREMIQKEPGYRELPLVAPDLNDPNTTKIYQTVSTSVAEMSETDVNSYQFDRPRKDSDLKRWTELMRKY